MPRRPGALRAVLRNSARAIVIRDGRILLTRNEDASGPYYLLPGGGQKPGETLHDALRRECLEETCAEVSVGPLLFVREYIGARHEFAEFDKGLHQVEFMFLCSLAAGAEARHPEKCDPRQAAVEWVDLSRLHEYPFYPRVLIPVLEARDFHGPPVYLGDTL